MKNSLSMIRFILFLLFIPVFLFAGEYSFQDSHARYMKPIPKSDGVLVLGWFANPLNIDGKKIVPPGKSNGKYELTYYMHSMDNAGNTQWLKSFTKKVMVRHGVAYGNTVYLAVDSKEKNVFDGSPISLGSSTGHYLSKLSPRGKWEWVLGTGGFIRDVNIDKSGNVLVIVQIEGGGKTPGGKTLVAGYSRDYVLLKVSPQGRILWEQQISGGKDLPNAQPRLSLVNQVASDSRGNVYVAGNFQGKSYIGGDGSQMSTKITYGPGEVLYDAETFIAKFDPLGNLISIFREIEKLDIVDLIDLAVDQNGDAYLTGYFSGDYIWAHKNKKPPSGSKQLFKSTGREDAFLVKIKDMKEVDWIIQPRGDGYERGESIILGDKYIEFLMTFGKTVQIQGKSFTEKSGESHKTDLLLMTLSYDGKIKNTVQLKGRGSERASLYGLGKNRYLYGLTYIKNGAGSYDFFVRYRGKLPVEKFNNDLMARSSHLENDLSTFNTGQKVRAYIEGSWYSGEVNKTSKQHYLLKMDNSQPEYWKWVKPVYLRDISYNPQESVVPPRHKTSDSFENKSVDQNIRVGSKVQVLWDGKWYKAKVLQLKNGKYYITYEGYGKEWDEWVNLDRIK